MPFFNDVVLLPDDPILSIPILFAADPNPTKVNLGIGAYKTAEGHPLVLTSVKKAEVQLLQKNLDKEYLPIEGDPEFLKEGLALLLGPDLASVDSTNIFTAQTIGGTGALRIAGEFLVRNGTKNIFLSQPSWANHKLIFERAGLNVGSYPYYDATSQTLDFNGMQEAIHNMPPGSVILFHGCCHNPSGVDPTMEQWKKISELVKQHQLIPLFDVAYQGFGEGLDEDAQAIRYFAKQGHEMIVCYSFSKNFGMYGERVGFLSFILENGDVARRVGSQIKTVIRSGYSNPPLHGARVVKKILMSPELSAEWQAELTNMCDRILQMRLAFVASLSAKGSNKKDFSYLAKQKGLFSFSGLNSDQVLRLRKEKGIYMPTNGRINIAGLNTTNLEYVSEAIISVL